jgi:hypothetical protein
MTKCKDMFPFDSVKCVNTDLNKIRTNFLISLLFRSKFFPSTKHVKKFILFNSSHNKGKILFLEKGFLGNKNILGIIDNNPEYCNKC